MKKQLFATVASVAAIFAVIFASSACFCFAYQPAEPKSLREE